MISAKSKKSSSIPAIAAISTAVATCSTRQSPAGAKYLSPNLFFFDSIIEIGGKTALDIHTMNPEPVWRQEFISAATSRDSKGLITAIILPSFFFLFLIPDNPVGNNPVTNMESEAHCNPVCLSGIETDLNRKTIAISRRRVRNQN